MGTWGVSLFSDDIASDLREDFRDLIADGLSSTDAVDKLILEYTPDNDPDIEPVFWLVLAATQWKFGRLDGRTKQRALTIINNGQDLKRWSDSKQRKKREIVLEKLKAQLLTPPPVARKVLKRFVDENEWEIGEIIGFQLASKRWVLLRVIGHHRDAGGKSAVCELLHWVCESPQVPTGIDNIPVRYETGPRGISQFLFQEPRNKKQLERIKRTNIFSLPYQKPGEYTAFIWNYIDRQFKDIFELE
jgi:hypothetical protein